MTRRRRPRGTDRRGIPLRLPRQLEGRRGRIVFLLLLAVGLAVALRHPGVLRPTRDLLLGRSGVLPEPRVQDVPAEDAVLARRRQGLRALLQAASSGRLVPPGATALAVVDETLVRDLLAPLFPRTYEIEQTWRVTITAANVSFQDGLALVRLDGRASVLGAESVFADVSLFGDLELLRDQPDAAVLRTRINLLALEARRVAVVVDAEAAEELVERLGKSRLAAFAAVTRGLEIPVRHRYTVELPAVVDGPVRIEAAEIPAVLAVLDAWAMGGRLWIAMAAALGDAPAPAPPRRPALPVPETLPGSPSAARTAALQEEVARLRRTLAELAGEQPLLAAGQRTTSHLTIGIAPALFEDAVRQVARRYLDVVEIVLEDLSVHETGERRRRVLFREVVVGKWDLSVRFPRIHGVLRAGEPDVELPGGERVDLVLPVHVEQGNARAHVRYEWDSRGLIGTIACRDFTLEDTVEGRVEPRVYPVSASFTLEATEDELVAIPSFDRRFRIHPEPSRPSWAKVSRALAEQDRLTRCGIGLDAEEELGKLRSMVARGFVVKLPRKLFRPVRVPTRVTPTVDVQGHPVEVVLTQSRLRAGADGIWWDVGISARATPP